MILKNIVCINHKLLKKFIRKQVYKNEKTINILEKEITDYLVDLSSHELPENDSKILSATFHVINDLERIGDHAENLADLTIQKINKKLKKGM